MSNTNNHPPLPASLARSLRPRLFAEVLGQGPVVTVLSRGLAQGNLPSTLLFSGTRGTGKTTLARLVAKAILCEVALSQRNTAEPCLRCSSCVHIDEGTALDYLEVDAASHNGVDHIRSLLEDAAVAPLMGRKKIYVLDEVHMLSNSAFNALLKTFEEPPKHVVFILATTAPDKIPDTVLSRCLHLELKPLNEKQLSDALLKTLQRYQIQLPNPTITQTLAHQARGSLRDLWSLMDQLLALSGSTEITEELLQACLGRVKTGVLEDIIFGLLEGQPALIWDLCQELMYENIDEEAFALQLMQAFHQLWEQHFRGHSFVYQTARHASDTVHLVDEVLWLTEQLHRDLAWAIKSLHPLRSLQLVLMKLAYRKDLVPNRPAQQDRLEEKLPSSSVDEKVTSKQNQDIDSALNVKTVSPEQLWELWKKLYQKLQQEYPAYASYFYQSMPVMDLAKGTIYLVLEADQDFLLERLASSECRQALHKVCLGLSIDESHGFNPLECAVELSKDNTTFCSLADYDQAEKKRQQDQQRQALLQDPGMLRVQKIFEQSVDKIILGQSVNNR